MEGKIRVTVHNEDTGEDRVYETHNTVTNCGRRFLEAYSAHILHSMDLDFPGLRTRGKLNVNGRGIEASDLYRSFFIYNANLPENIQENYFPVDRYIVRRGRFQFTERYSTDDETAISQTRNIVEKYRLTYSYSSYRIGSIVRFFGGCIGDDTSAISNGDLSSAPSMEFVYPSDKYAETDTPGKCKSPYILDTGRVGIFYYDKNAKCFYQYEYDSDNSGVTTIRIYRISNVNLPPFSNPLVDNLTYGENNDDRQLVLTIDNPLKSYGTNKLSYGMDGYAYVTSRASIADGNQNILKCLKIDFRNASYSVIDIPIPVIADSSNVSANGNAGCIIENRLFYVSNSGLVSLNLTTGGYNTRGGGSSYTVYNVFPAVRGVVMHYGKSYDFNLYYYDVSDTMWQIAYAQMSSSSIGNISAYKPIDDDNLYVIEEINNGTDLLALSPVYVGAYANFDPPIDVRSRETVILEYTMMEDV